MTRKRALTIQCIKNEVFLAVSAVPLFQSVRDETSSSSDNINLFKVTKETLKKGVKYVQCKQQDVNSGVFIVNFEQKNVS